MAEPLKNLINETLIGKISSDLKAVIPAWNHADFMKSVFNEAWKDFELKQRIKHVSSMIHQEMDMPYVDAVHYLMKVAHGFSGFEYSPST